MAAISGGDELKEALMGLTEKSDEGLRELLDRLYAEESEISYRRRIMHGQIDILKAELVRRLKNKNRAPGSLLDDYDITKLSEIIAKNVVGHK